MSYIVIRKWDRKGGFLQKRFKDGIVGRFKRYGNAHKFAVKCLSRWSEMGMVNHIHFEVKEVEA